MYLIITCVKTELGEGGRELGGELGRVGQRGGKAGQSKQGGRREHMEMERGWCEGESA